MSELKARITLDSSQFKRTLNDVSAQARKTAGELGKIGKAGLSAGQGVAAGALTLGALAVGKNAKAFTEVRNASVALGVAVARLAQPIDAVSKAFGGVLTSGRSAIKATAELGRASRAALALIAQPALKPITQRVKTVFDKVASPVNKAVAVVTQKVKTVFDPIRARVIAPARQLIKSVFAPFRGLTLKPITQRISVFFAPLKSFFNLVAPDLGRVASAFGSVFGSIGKTVGKALGAIGPVVKGAFGVVGAGLNYIGAVTKGVASRIGSTLLSIGKMGATAALAVAAGIAAATGVLAKGLHDALSAGAKIDQLAAQTGAPKKDIAILGQAFKDLGLDSDSVAPAINKMQKALNGVNAEGEPTNKTFERLGLSVDELKKLSPTEQFQKISTAIAGLKDPSERAAAAMGIFGKKGGALNRLFTNPEAIKNAQEVLGGQADLLAKNSAKFEKVHNAFANIGIKIRGFFVGVASSLLPKLEALADFLNSIDLSGIGQKIGASLSSGINILVNAFKTGKVGELLGLSLKAGLATAGDFLIGVFQTAINVLAEGLGLIFSGDYWSAIINGFYGVSLKVMAFFQKALETPIIYGSAAFTIAFESAIKVFYKLQDLFTNIANYFVAAIKTGVQAVIALLPKKFQPTGFKKQSFDENLAEEKRKSSPPLGDEFKISTWGEAVKDAQKRVPDYTKQTNSAADDFLKAAGQSLGSLGSKVAAILGRNVAAFKSGDLFGSKELRDQLAALAKSLNIPIEKVKETAEKVVVAASEGELGLPEGKDKPEKADKATPNIEADQFARIGLFSTTAAASASLTDFARRTADNTGKMVALLDKHLAKPAEAATAVAG